MIIGLNPSTADESLDDPTIRRCKRFAKEWGFGGLCMVNLFALRATKPKELIINSSPIGNKNDNFIKSLSRKAGMILVAWGNKGTYKNRDKEVCNLITDKIYCLGITKENQPKHPLYIKSTVKPMLFN